MIYKLCILGVTGSIGSQTLLALKTFNNYDLKAISIGNQIDKLDNILNSFPSIDFICVKNKTDFLFLKKKYINKKFFYGDKGLIKLIKKSSSDVFVNALVGYVGLLPSISILKMNKTLLLANKESLVVGGEIINKLLDTKHGKLYPIDSEHVAISKCLYNMKKENVKKIVITASGGPFFNYDKKELNKVTLKEALTHPTWSMGRKISIDSATMMNKTFEIIEAYYLFDFPLNKIDTIVDRKSYVHSYVIFKNETRLQVGNPTMIEPIKYALSFGYCKEEKFDDVEINTIANYKLLPLSKKQFPLLNYADLVIKNKGNYGCVLNAVNEVCVQAFIEGKIHFIDIEKIIDKVMSSYHFSSNINILALNFTNKKVRRITNKIIRNMVV
ncbi:MAG: 1-deoxy-D-xylulose-5-phosphate reductoisomerase [Bacilli bacterium]